MFSVSATGAAEADAGTTGLGEALSAASMEGAPQSSLPSMVGEPPPEPTPGQARPDSKGRCPHKRQVALNGACWVPFEPDSEECEVFGGHLFRGRCYVPARARNRPTTSQSPRKP
jgi:hypothetical protein